MSDLLAVITEDEEDEQVLAEISRRHPTRVTVLLDTDEPDPLLTDDAAASDRLAGLLDAIERKTGATVVGLAGSREQLEGWRFDRVVGAEAR